MTIQDTLGSGLAAVRRRFSNHVNVIQTAAGVEPLPGKSLHANWIVGRGLCLYRCEDFSNVPKNRRRAAMELRIPVWSPFEHTGHHCVWSGSTAMVWLWNADAVTQANGGPGVQPDARREVPETIFLPRQSDGMFVQACQHGFDLQHWRDGVLRDSFWSAEEPTQAVLNDFLLGHGEPAAEVNVTASLAPPAADPWATPISPADWLATNEQARFVATGPVRPSTQPPCGSKRASGTRIGKPMPRPPNSRAWRPNLARSSPNARSSCVCANSTRDSRPTWPNRRRPT